MRRPGVVLSILPHHSKTDRTSLKQEYTNHKFKLQVLYSFEVRQINIEFCFYSTSVCSADFPTRLAQERKAIRKDPYHTLLWGEKVYFLFRRNRS